MDIYNDLTATAEGEFTDGDPLANPPVPRTVLRDIWPNMIQRELINLVEGAGLELDGFDFTQVLQAVQAIAATAASDVVPTGLVADWTSTTPPSGWLSINGETIGDTGSGATHTGSTFEALYKHLWDNYSNTDVPISGGRGASADADWIAGKTATLLDDRGLVRRGYDSTGTVDPEGNTRGFGSYQADEFKEHVHGLSPAPVSDPNTPGVDGPGNAGDGTNVSETEPSGGQETRMKNRAYNPIIKI